MYEGYLHSFYSRYRHAREKSYQEHYDLLLSDTTEFAGSYTRHFIKAGLDAKCVISNDKILQSKWGSEHKISSDKSGNLLYEQVKEFKPDILWLEDMTCIDKSWIERVRENIKSIKLIIAYHCAPYKRDLVNKLRNADFIITCTPGLKDFFENEGMRAYLVYHGFDSELLPAIISQKKEHNKLIFAGSLITGSSFHNSRIQLIETLIKEHIDISLYVNLEKKYRIRAKQLIYLLSGLLEKMKLSNLTRAFPVFEYGRSMVSGYSGELVKMNNRPLYGLDIFNLLAGADIVLNIHAGVAGEYAGNMRMFEVTGVGSCLLTDNKRNIGELFEIDKEVVVYDSPQDCIEKARWLLEHDTERKEIASRGQNKTLTTHTVENRTSSIVDIIIRELTDK